MDFYEAFSSIIDGKEDKYVLWELIYESWNQLCILQRKYKVQ